MAGVHVEAKAAHFNHVPRQKSMCAQSKSRPPAVASWLQRGLRARAPPFVWRRPHAQLAFLPIHFVSDGSPSSSTLVTASGPRCALCDEMYSRRMAKGRIAPLICYCACRRRSARWTDCSWPYLAVIPLKGLHVPLAALSLALACPTNFVWRPTQETA